jgi:hypothetical protein
MYWKVHEDYQNLDGYLWMRSLILKVGTENIDWFKLDKGGVRYRREADIREADAWGACYSPTRKKSRKTGKTMAHNYRLSCHMIGRDEELPLVIRYDGWRRINHHGFVRSEYVTQNMSELAICIMAHEYGHYLSHSKKVQIPNDERSMDTLAYEMMYTYREGGSQERLIETLENLRYSNKEVRHSMIYAPHRYPYREYRTTL